MNQLPHPSVLIVEDDGLIAMHLTEVLEKAGYDVMKPENSGEKAIARLQAPPYPDIILMDIGLNGKLDGIETARQIRKNYDIPIVFLTAYSDEERIVKAAEVSPYGYLIKPCTGDEILNTVKEILQIEDKAILS